MAARKHDFTYQHQQATIDLIAVSARFYWAAGIFSHKTEMAVSNQAWGRGQCLKRLWGLWGLWSVAVSALLVAAPFQALHAQTLPNQNATAQSPAAPGTDSKGIVGLPFSASDLGPPPLPWRVVGLPGQNKSTTPVKPLTRFDITSIDGRHVLRVATDASYGNLVHTVPNIELDGKTQLRWSWRLDQPLVDADLRQRRSDDSPLKLCLLFDMPTAKLSLFERSMLSFARSVTGEKLPSATLCYVWDHQLPVGTLLSNAFTSRMRMLVLGSGDKRLGQWVTHQRDVAADFKLAFGRENGADTLPPLQGLLVGADSDSTAGQSLGYVGDITLGP